MTEDLSVCIDRREQLILIGLKTIIRILVTFLPIFITSISYAQINAYCEYTFPSPFGCNNNFFVIDSADNQNCIWQYGITVKPNFETYDPHLITDTLNNYPTDNYSSISLIITTASMPGIDWFPIDYIRTVFFHTMESDTLTDGGYVEYSEDNGLNWVNAFDLNYNTVNPGYSDVSSLFNGELGFSGNYSDHACLVEYYPSINTDTVLLRIVFVSDSINTNKGGWQLNSLGMTMWINTNIDEVKFSNSNIFPNPTTGDLHIKVNGVIDASYTITIYDTQGKTVDIITTNEHETVIDISKYPQGVYWLRVLGSNIVRSEKIIKLMTD